MPRIAILDDYAGAALEVADWSPVLEKAQMTVFDRHLSEDELARWRARDLAVGRTVLEPAGGVVAGINASGEALITSEGHTAAVRSGSLTFAEPLACS